MADSTSTLQKSSDRHYCGLCGKDSEDPLHEVPGKQDLITRLDRDMPRPDGSAWRARQHMCCRHFKDHDHAAGGQVRDWLARIDWTFGMLGHVTKSRRTLSHNSRVEKGLVTQTVNANRLLVSFSQYIVVRQRFGTTSRMLWATIHETARNRWLPTRANPQGPWPG